MARIAFSNFLFDRTLSTKGHAADVLQQLKIFTSFAEAGLYKECQIRLHKLENNKRRGKHRRLTFSRGLNNLAPDRRCHSLALGMDMQLFVNIADMSTNCVNTYKAGISN
jgi:hypothetical protein